MSSPCLCLLVLGTLFQEPSVQLPSGLQRVLTDYETAWQARDAAALSKLFVEDGFVLPNGSPPVKGRDAIQKFYTGAGGPLALRALGFATEGKVGYIIGAFGSKPGGADSGKFTLTLRQVGESWMIVSDMDNGNSRPK